MRSRTRLFPALLLSVLLAACIPRVPPPVFIPPEMPAGEELARQREMLAFAFITYAGEELHGTDKHVEGELVPCIQNELDTQPLTRGKWDLVWGPIVYKFAGAKLDDNMMFVARNRHDPDHLVVALRGTNAKAILDWIEEDFDVFHTERWQWGEPPPGSDPRISRATHTGLTILQRARPLTVPEPRPTVREFLAEAVKTSKSGKVRIDVTGHSLAGALAPTLTLWLADTREKWDPHGKAKLAVYAYAGATAGNADFAAYSDSRIGAVTHRVHNPYDLVPMAWNLSTLEALPEIYGSTAPMEKKVRHGLNKVLKLLRNTTYTQIRPDQPPIPGGVMTSLTKFAEQAEFQHHCGYLCGLKMNEEFTPVSYTCQPDYEPGPGCPKCPDDD